MNPRLRLANILDTLQAQRAELFKLYTEAKLESNKSAVLYAQLDVMKAITKIKKMLKIPLEDEDKKAEKGVLENAI